MRRLGVAELKENINEVLHEVEQGETVAVVRNGRVAARLVPVRRPKRSQAEIDEIIAEMDRVAVEIGAHWPAGVTALDAHDVRS